MDGEPGDTARCGFSRKNAVPNRAPHALLHVLLFPGRGAVTAALVRPDQALPDALAIDETPGKETVTALFGQRPFSVTERPTRDDIEVVTVSLVKAP